MQITTQRALPSSPATVKKKQPKNDSRLLKNSEGYRDGERNFCREKELDNAWSCKWSRHS